MRMRVRTSTLCRLCAALLLAAALAPAASGQAPAHSPRWEVVAVTDAAQNSHASAPQTPELEVEVRDGGVVLITVDRPATVKVFSILGQLITEKNVQPGTVRLRMDSRGIYILKAGTATRRINL